jgi:phage recombination protein Bet
MNKSQKVSTATQAVQAIKKGKNARLLSLVPEGQSPKVYVDLIKTQVLGVDRQGNPRPDEDLLLFLYTCKRTGLDPLTKQIYAVYRWDSRQGKEVMTIQTGIDGMRLVAQRSGKYAGQDDVEYMPKDEADEHPTKASVAVYKQIGGTRVSFAASARWSEYIQKDKKGKPMGLWTKMPYLMLGKCAEALALRKAFPNELSGIYADEEMTQAKDPLADLPKPTKLEKPKSGGTTPAKKAKLSTEEPQKRVKTVKPTTNTKVEQLRADLEGQNASK